MCRVNVIRQLGIAAFAMFLAGCAAPGTPLEVSATTRLPQTLTPTMVPATLPPPTRTPVPASIILQEGNDSERVAIRPDQSGGLADNQIGTDLGSYDPGYNNPDVVYPIGFRWIRTSFSRDVLNWQRVEQEPGEYTIDLGADARLTDYAQNGITILLNLGVGDWENRLDTTRFRSQAEIDRYGEFVRVMVRHFRDRVQYYELWNEPGDITVSDYARLVRHVVPIIREEYPEARIVIGAVPGNWESGYPGYEESGRFTLDVDYLRGLITSGVAPLADGISWHPFYGNRPDDPYYQSYPDLVREIQELAASEGFTGEFFAEESVWRTAGDEADPMIQRVSESVATKYFLRSIVIHRGLGVVVTIALPGAHDPTLPKVQAIRDMCLVMAGAEPASLAAVIQSEATDIETYGFSLPNGDHLIALWTDGLAVDEDAGVRAALTLEGLAASQVMGIDVLHGIEQPMLSSQEGANLVIPNLLVRDYPILLRITTPSN